MVREPMLLLLACHSPDDSAAPEPGPALVFDGERPTNLLVLSIDTLRVDALSGGYAPFLASIAEESVWTEATTTCSSWTEPGTTCALAGQRAEELGALPRPDDEGASSPDPSNPTLATWMAEAGYQTALLSANSIHAHPFYAQGYDTVSIEPDMAAAALVDAALLVPRTAPWLLHVHFFDPHNPYTSEAACLADLEGRPELAYDITDTDGQRLLLDDWDSLSAEDQEEIRTQLRIRYYAQVTCMDTELRRFWETLDAAGALDDTLVVIWSDHGEQLLDHDSIGHAGTMWPEVNDGLLYWCSRNLFSRTISAPTTLQDLVPTTFTALELPVPEGTGMEVGSAADDRVTFGTVRMVRFPPQQQVTRKGVRLRYNWGGTKALYRHAGDPEERRDVYDPEGQAEAALWELLLPEVDRIRPLDPEEEPVDPGP